MVCFCVEFGALQVSKSRNRAKTRNGCITAGVRQAVAQRRLGTDDHQISPDVREQLHQRLNRHVAGVIGGQTGGSCVAGNAMD